jgi:hypothetical protein
MSPSAGIYAWVGGEAEGDGPLNLGEEAGGMFQRPVVHVAIYVHYEHAFATALRDVPLPQVLCNSHKYKLPLSASTVPTSIAHATDLSDFVESPKATAFPELRCS